MESVRLQNIIYVEWCNKSFKTFTSAPHDILSFIQLDECMISKFFYLLFVLFFRFSMTATAEIDAIYGKLPTFIFGWMEFTSVAYFAREIRKMCRQMVHSCWFVHQVERCYIPNRFLFSHQLTTTEKNGIAKGAKNLFIYYRIHWFEFLNFHPKWQSRLLDIDFHAHENGNKPKYPMHRIIGEFRVQKLILIDIVNITFPHFMPFYQSQHQIHKLSFRIW